MSFEYEAADQDGFRFRAIEVWPSGQEPVRDVTEVRGPSDAYRSTARIDVGFRQTET